MLLMNSRDTTKLQERSELAGRWKPVRFTVPPRAESSETVSTGLGWVESADKSWAVAVLRYVSGTVGRKNGDGERTAVPPIYSECSTDMYGGYARRVCSRILRRYVW